jgi:hypothetical protein
MASTAAKWVIGCGVGCGVVLLLVVGIFVALGLFVRGSVKEFGTAERTRHELEERFGDPEDFTPWPAGAIPADRIEAFLSVRAATAESRAALVEAFAAIPMSEEEAQQLEDAPTREKISTVFNITKSAFGLVPAMGGFFDARNSSLLEEGMSLGEYEYLYTLIYYSWLRHSPDDGPQDEEGGGEVDLSAPGVDRRVRRELAAMLRNQLQAASEDDPSGFRERLAAEVEAVERDSRRLPWSDGPPEVTAASLEPFRERLEQAYDPASNPFELTISEQKGMSIQAH